MCDGVQKCKVVANGDVAGDPCGGIEKDTHVKFYCRDRDDSSTAYYTDCEVDTCSDTCGGGVKKCERDCVNGSPGDFGCALDGQFKVEYCNSAECPSEWAAWSDYGDCSATCGGGVQERFRAGM